MGYLKDAKCYLSGPIENEDPTYNWRLSPKKHLIDTFGVDIFDPYEDPKQDMKGAILEARKNRDFEEIRRIAKGFVRKDLAIVQKMDFLIAFLPYKVPTAGTCHEIIVANDLKIPTLLVCLEGAEFVPLWYYGFISYKFMFGSWNDLYAYLKEVDDGLHKNNDRWWMVNQMI